MTLHIEVPNEESANDGAHKEPSASGPRILVIGVGGGGCNAVNNMVEKQLEGVTFLACNTDMQALEQSKADHVMQLGPSVTGGLGAGSRSDIGRQSAEESLPQLMQHLEAAHMVFIAAGMGGGTGTGAAPVIARAAREAGCLTVGVVTKPFQYEGVRRARAAEEGISEFSEYVDTLIVIPNQNLFRVANEHTTYAESFKLADEVLYQGVRGVTDLIVVPGQINLDFNDIRNVMQEMGRAMMGTGEAEGEGRAQAAADLAIDNPLLDASSMHGARSILINISGGEDLTLFEVDEAVGRICSEVGEEVDITFGSAFDPRLNGRIRISLIATGIAEEAVRSGEVESLSGERKARPPTPIRVFTPASAPKLMPVGSTVGSTSGGTVAPAASASGSATATAGATASTASKGVGAPLTSPSVGGVLRSGAATATAAALAIEPEPEPEPEAQAESKTEEAKATAPNLKAVPTPSAPTAPAVEASAETAKEEEAQPSASLESSSVESAAPAMASPAAMPTAEAPKAEETPKAETSQAETPKVQTPAPFIPPAPQATRSEASSVAVRVAQNNEEKKQTVAPMATATPTAHSAPAPSTSVVATPPTPAVVPTETKPESETQEVKTAEVQEPSSEETRFWDRLRRERQQIEKKHPQAKAAAPTPHKVTTAASSASKESQPTQPPLGGGDLTPKTSGGVVAEEQSLQIPSFLRR